MGKLKQRKGKGKETYASQRINDISSSAKPLESTSPSPYNPSIISLLIYFIKVILLSILSIPFWIITPMLSIIYGRPPKMVDIRQTIRFIHYAIYSTHISSINAKIELILTITLHTMTSPVSGFCWLLDELLYSKHLNTTPINKPLFVLSAYRSASTSVARTLASDTNHFIAPTAIMCAFPYLWLWKLVTYIVGDGITKDEANAKLNSKFTKESLERHDNNHFAIDTFDGYFLGSHLNGLAYHLGPDVMVKELNNAFFEEYNRILFEKRFVDYIDRIARKTLLFNGVMPSQQVDERCFLLKGHFLQSASALQRKYPDARFLTVLRDPLDRIQSGINHMAVNATLWQGKPVRWDWLAKAYQQIEVTYCKQEMVWYKDCSTDDHKHRLAIKFDAYVKNHDKAMKSIYRDLLQYSDDDIPDFKSPQSKKGSKHYTINRSLRELGVDEVGLKLQLSDYYDWMKKQ